MNSLLVDRMLPGIIEELEHSLLLQEELDLCYDGLVGFLLEEAGNSMPIKEQRRLTTKHKQYWDEELTKNWKSMKECERIYRKSLKGCEDGRRKKCEAFKSAQHCFDRNLKRKKRSHDRGKLVEIERCCTSDPQKFWDYIKKLGPKKKTGIPWEVEIEGKLVTDRNSRLDKWCSEYVKLYSMPKDKSFNDTFKQERISELPGMVTMNTNAPGYATLNAPIRYEEVKLAVQ